MILNFLYSRDSLCKGTVKESNIPEVGIITREKSVIIGLAWNYAIDSGLAYDSPPY